MNALLVALALALAPQGDAAAAEAALARGELARALALAHEAGAGASRVAVEALYRGRRFAEARDEAIRALEHTPDDAVLALRAVQSSVWLRRAEDGHGDLARLALAIERGVEPAHAAAWSATAEGLAADLARIDSARATLAAAMRRARGIAIAGGVVALAAGLALVTRARGGSSRK